jgi:hypothetical protein
MLYNCQRTASDLLVPLHQLNSLAFDPFPPVIDVSKDVRQLSALYLGDIDTDIELTSLIKLEFEPKVILLYLFSAMRNLDSL